MPSAHPARHLLRAKDLADGRYFEPLSVAALAAAAGLSPAHFSREFRRAFGESPHRYLLTRRLERAAALLRNTDRTVADICLMLKRLTHVNLWVHDQDEALAFYTRKVGFEPRQDVTLAEFGNYRFLTVGPPLQPEVHFILGVPGPPVHDPDTAARMNELVAKGAMSGLSFEVDDCRATYSELKGRGVEMIQEPNEVPWGIDAAFRDLSGNHIRFVQIIP